MKNKLGFVLITLGCYLLLNLLPPAAHAQGTAFTYNGRLNDGAGPATGSYDLRFKLYSAITNGSVSGELTNAAVGVSNGLFAVTLDFGGVFNGSNYWLELAVRTNGGAAFITLNPRQPVLPVPYAIYSTTAGNAMTAVTAGSVSAANISGTLILPQLPGTVLINNQANVNLGGTFAGDGGGLTNLNPMSLASGSVGAMLFFTNQFDLFVGGFSGYHSGDGNSLTNLNPMSLASGNVGAQLYFTNRYNFFSGGFAGYHAGDGSGLTNVSVDAVTGGLTINVPVLVPGGGTNVLCFTNGILRAIQ